MLRLATAGADLADGQDANLVAQPSEHDLLRRVPRDAFLRLTDSCERIALALRRHLNVTQRDCSLETISERICLEKTQR